MKSIHWLLGSGVLLLNLFVRAEDGYDLWLRYAPIEDAELRETYTAQLGEIVSFGAGETIAAARDELETGLNGILDYGERSGPPIVVGSFAALPTEYRESLQPWIGALGEEGYHLHRFADRIHITAKTDQGVLYGVFSFLRLLQAGVSVDELTRSSAPPIRHRLLNHWDNLNRTVERGQAGLSLWEWFQLPDYISPRYRDYARANASIGINGTVISNVNANARILTGEYLKKAAAIADALRPYGIRVYLTARFSAPMELDGLATADPLDPAVRAWWIEKTEEIYKYIPDFGGFLVKANSEGQPGPQDYGRHHADGANMLADALAPHGGFVMWRAFVYSHENTVDRHKQAVNEFVPLDGEFRENVVIQVKNGAIDFMPREPFHPLFGAMTKTPLALELQIAKEYLGGAVHLAFLGPLFEEALDSDTFSEGEGSTVAKVIDGSLHEHELSVIAGVANAGSVRNWTGHPLAQADWYAFGRLAWDPTLDSADIVQEWIGQTFGNDPIVVEVLSDILLESREAVVNYSMPLGLHHIMARGHHYGPGPWVEGGRADWTSPYYHRADAEGLGFDRTPSGSNALEQYAPEIQEQWGDPTTIPPQFLLWFHHVGWETELASGRTLWEDLGIHYQRGVDAVRSWQWSWEGLSDRIDPERHAHVAALLARQEREAIEYKDACLLYFQTFSKLPWPSAAEPALYPLEYYRNFQRHHVPGDPADQ